MPNRPILLVLRHLMWLAAEKRAGGGKEIAVQTTLERLAGFIGPQAPRPGPGRQGTA